MNSVNLSSLYYLVTRILILIGLHADDGDRIPGQYRTNQ